MPRWPEAGVIERDCATCGKSFTVERWRLNVDACLYCSPACNGVARRGSTTRPEIRNEIVRLYTVEQLTREQIGAAVGLSPATVWGHLKRAGIPTRRRASTAPPKQPYRPKTVAERFWPKVNKTATCWLWAAGRQGDYGQMSAGQRGQPPLRAHRVSWEIHNGPIPAGMFVLHRCDVPLCVNPAHLFLGDAEANAKDMKAKGRHWSQRK